MAAIHVPPSSRRWALRVVTILGGSVLLHRGQAREGKALAGTKGQRGGLRASGAVSGPTSEPFLYLAERPRGWAGQAQDAAHLAPAPPTHPHGIPPCTQQRGSLLRWHTL